jgi:hypothetical protein
MTAKPPQAVAALLIGLIWIQQAGPKVTSFPALVQLMADVA